MPVASLAWTGFYALMWCSAFAAAQLPKACTELPELDVTRNGSSIILHRARAASPSQVSETSCICYPVLRGEQDIVNVTCDNVTLSNVTCQEVGTDKDANIEIEIDEAVSSGEASICYFSNCGNKNCSLYDATKDVATVGDLNITLVNLTTAFVSWSTHHPYRLDVRDFRVTWCIEANCSSNPTCLKNGSLSEDRNLTDVSTTIGGLSPATSLRLRVTPLGLRGNSFSGCIDVPAEDPESIKSLRATPHGLDGLQLQWTQPVSYNESLDSCKVRYCVTENQTGCPKEKELFLKQCSKVSSNVEVKNTSYNIPRLKPMNSVVVGVTTVRRYPSGVVTTSEETVECFKTPGPGVITDFRATNITSRNATLVWKFQQDGYQEIRPTSYNVTWCATSDRQCSLNVSESAGCQRYNQATVKGRETTLDITGLPPWSAVVVTVRGLYTNGTDEVSLGNPSTYCFESLVGAPGSIRNISARDITSRNATVHWTFQEDGYEELLPASYNVKWCAWSESRCPSNASVSAACRPYNQARVNASQSTLNVTSLPPWSAILMTVSALYSNGSNEVALGDPGTYCFETLAEAPEMPRELQITTVEATSANVEWREPTVKNGPLDGYVLTVCAVNESMENNCTEASSQDHMINDSSTTTFKLSDLTPWTTYTITLVAFNRDVGGFEMLSGASTESFRTDAVAPGKVAGLFLVEATNRSISLNWSKPEFTGGKVDHYDVTHCIVESCEGVSEQCETLQTDEETANLTDLRPWTLYSVRVAAVNAMINGTELRGEAAKLCERTKSGVPSRPENLRVTPKKDCIEISWKRPSKPNGELPQYKVDICREDVDKGTKCNTRTVSGGETRTTFNHLAPWTAYSVSVAAQNTEGSVVLESESVSTTVTTPPDAASEPLNLKTTEEQQSIDVTWDEPEFPRGPVHGYNVSWIIQDWLGRVTAAGSLVTNTTACRLPTWKPYSNYTLSVRAFHRVEDAEPLYGDAALAAFNTSVDAPDGAKVDVAVGSRAAAIFLSVAGSPNGPLNGFVWCNYARDRVISASNESEGQAACANESRTTNRLLLLQDLRPWTDYTFSARAYNLDPVGSPLEGPETWTHYKTEQDAPSPPRNFSVARFESRCLILNWSEPAEKNGEMEGYMLAWNRNADGREINRTDVGPRSVKISSLEPYTEYKFELNAYNEYGSKRLVSPPVRICARTLPEAPGPVMRLAVKAFKNNTVHLSWYPPNQKRGVVQSYLVIYNATKPGKPALRNVRSETLTVASVCHGMPAVCTFDVEELPAEYVYSFDVRGININVSAWGDAQVPPIRVEVPAGDPPPPKNMSLVAGDCPSTPEPDTQKMFLIYKDMFDDRNGEIRQYDVVVGSAELINNDVENDITWKDVSRSQPTPPHVVTPHGWNPFLKESSGNDPLNCEPVRGREGTMMCTIGSEMCDDTRHTPCNGPLRGGTEYAMYVIAYTKGGSRASSPEVFITELPEEPSTAGAIAGGILTAIIIMAAILAVLVIHRRRLARQKQANSKRASAEASNMNTSLVHLVQMSDVNGSATKPSSPVVQDEQIEMEHHVIKDINKPIPKIEFRSHLAMMMKDSAYRFADEYERLVELSAQYPSDVARHPANSKKNRFTNIHPFDRSRVPLSVIGEDEQSSYINASFVKGCNSDREYIAAQGPNALTVNDFWRMIWEHDVKIIIMLTQFVEGNKKKCEKYWPDDNKEHAYGCVQVRKDTTAEREDFVLTEFRIKSDDSSKWRTLRHVFFTAWKDHGTPEKPETLIQFVRTCQGMFGPRGGSQPPILVHCSAGVGRTGTFIALDMCLQKLEVDDEVDIFHLVLDLRECRRCMVQNEKQYTYLYHCVAAVIDEMYGCTVQNEPIYENVAALMSGSAC